MIKKLLKSLVSSTVKDVNSKPKSEYRSPFPPPPYAATDKNQTTRINNNPRKIHSQSNEEVATASESSLARVHAQFESDSKKSDLDFSIKLKFGKSTSANYSIAVEMAKSHATYEEFDDGKQVSHSVTFSSDEIDDFFSLYEIVGNWKSAVIAINGKVLAPAQSRFMYCFQERSKAFNPVEYCFGLDDGRYSNDNDYGCQHTGINPYSWEGLSAYGKMDSKGVFHVNKAKLQHDVLRNLNDYKYCPALDVEKVVQKVLNDIPDKINPKTNNSWEYITEYDDNLEKQVAVSVRKKSKRSRYVLPDRQF